MGIICSFQSYQLSSVKWHLSGSLLTAVYSFVQIRATVGGLLASGLLAGGIFAGACAAGGFLPRGGIFKVERGYLCRGL